MDPSPPPASPTEDVEPDVALEGDAVDGSVQPDAEAGPEAGRGEFRESVDDALQAVRGFWSSDRATKLRFAGDLVALVPLVALLWWMANHDGGREPGFFLWAAVITLAAAPVALVEASRLPRTGRVLVAWWGVGMILALAFAQERNFWVQPTMVLAVVPLAGLCTHRLWRRPWGPTLVLGVLLVGFGMYAYRAFLTWWGDTLADRAPVWRPLSWHNQSGALMGAAAVVGLGLATTGRRWIALTGGALATLGIAGVWLAGSRGALVTTAAGVVLVLAVAALRKTAWTTALWRAAVALAAGVAVVLVLTAMVPQGAATDAGVSFSGSSSQPLANRADDPVGNFSQRLRHMQAALGMFTDNPLTGEGLGAYRIQALEHTPPDARLTSSAHNEPLEMLGEGGLALGLPFLLVQLGGLWLAARWLWRRPEGEIAPDEARRPVLLGLAVAVPTVFAHTLLDFDWDFPVLPVLLAVGIGALYADRHRDRDERVHDGRLRGLTAVPLALVLALGLGGAFIERAAAAGDEDLTPEEFAAQPLPWQGERAADHAMTLSRRGEHELAAGLIQETIDWHPGVTDYRATASIILFRAGAIDATELVARIRALEPTFALYNLAAEALIDEGALDAAPLLLDDVLDLYVDYERWGLDAVRAETWYLVAERELAADGCDAAVRAIVASVAQGAVPVGFVPREFGPLQGPACPTLVEDAVEQAGQ